MDKNLGSVTVYLLLESNVSSDFFLRLQSGCTLRATDVADKRGLSLKGEVGGPD